jgi:FKBP-type peptidyl-prolyl cis-trans isomerase
VRLAPFLAGASALLFAPITFTFAAENPPTAAPITHSPQATAYAELLKAWGRIIARESDADKFGFDEAQIAALVNGLKRGARKAPPPYPLDPIIRDVLAFVEVRKGRVREDQKRKNLAAFPAYFETLKSNARVQALPSGLCVEVIHAGDGPAPAENQTVLIRYTARLVDGTVFDSTEQTGPIETPLAKIIPGWAEGIKGMRVGGKSRLHVPPALAFNDNDAAMMGIPPASTIVADIELLAIKDTPPAEEAPPPPLAPMPAPSVASSSAFSDAQLIETWGWLLAQERGVIQADLAEADVAHLSRGLADALKGVPATYDEVRAHREVMEFVASRRNAHERSVLARRDAQTAAFFEALKTNARVVQLPSGLCYEILKHGEGAFPRGDQRVRVNYVGTLIDGTIFDRTDPELGPLEVDLGHVIRGWTEGAQKINRGGRIKLYVPPALAYGDVSTGGIPARSALVFEIELLDFYDIPAGER